MFDIGWPEIFIVGILALIVVGPKDLPQAIRTITRWVQKARSLSREFQSGVNEMVREAELHDIKKTITEGGSGLKDELEKSIDPEGDMTKSFGLDDEGLSASELTPVKEDFSPEILNATENMEEVPAPAETDAGDDVMPVKPPSDKA